MKAKLALGMAMGLALVADTDGNTDEVRALAEDLSAPPAFQRWIMDLASPGLLRLLHKNLTLSLSESGSSGEESS